MQKRLESILEKETLQIAFHIEISKQAPKKQIRTDTTKQDMLWRDSLHGSSVDSIELDHVREIGRELHGVSQHCIIFDVLWGFEMS